MRERIGSYVYIAAAILAGVALRIAYGLFLANVHGDIAVVALMAKHISELREFYIYMPLAHYSAALSAYIAAVCFRLCGATAGCVTGVGVALSCLWAGSVYYLARMTVDRRSALVAVALTLIPPFFLLYYSISVLGGYAEGLVIIPLILALLIRWSEVASSRTALSLGALGVCAGLGLWIAPTFMPVLLTIATVLTLRAPNGRLLRRFFLLFAAGLIVGYIPAILYNIQHPLATFFRIGGSILDLDRTVLSGPDPASVIGARVLRQMLRVPGVLASEPVSLVLILGGAGAAVFAYGLYAALKERVVAAGRPRRIDGLAIVTVYIAWHCLFVAILSCGTNARYMFPVAALAPLYIGTAISRMRRRSRIIAAAVCVVLVGYNAYGTGSALWRDHRVDYGEAGRWLEAHGARAGYADWMIAYAVTFATAERVVVSPTLFHRDFSDRWPAWTAQVRRDPRSVFILSRDPALLYAVEKRLRRLGVSYRKKVFDDLVIYYDCSRQVFPEELQLSGERTG